MITYFCEVCKLESNKSECQYCGGRTKPTSKVYWCHHCNIPLYYEHCSICGNESEYIGSDIRPVFPKERLLIELLVNAPLKYVNESVWNIAGNRYIVNGIKLDLLVEDLVKKSPDDIRNGLSEYSIHNSSKAFKEYIDLFIKANRTRYDFITTEAMHWITEKAHRFDNSSMFVSFSGGKDSTVVSDLVIKALGRSDIIHIFGNTTLEFQFTIDYINRFKKTHRKTPVLISENKQQDFFTLCESFGPPSRMLRWCCTVFKTGFIGQKVQRVFKDKKTVLTFYGIRRFESNSRSKYVRTSESPKISKQRVASPIIDWTDLDIWLYILVTGVDFNEAYQLGYSRVGCWCCPNNTTWAQFLSSIYMPEETKRFYNMLLNFAVKMGKSNPEEYVSSGGWKQRHGGAGLELSKRVAISFRPCATDSFSFLYELNKPITVDMYEFFKPFGILRFDMGNPRLGEVYILNHLSRQPIMKLQGRIGSNTLRITVLNTPIAERTKLIEIELKFKCQITKYQLCVGCHACETACKYDAISLTQKENSNTEFRYIIDVKRCVNCYSCINHYDSGCYMKRVLLPRGKGYKKDE